MHAEELWTGSGFKAGLCRTLLTPASWLYALGWQGYLAVYRLGIKMAREPHSPVVCIGNLQVGGTGKTPVTLHVAEVLRGTGRDVVVSCSGYGSPASEAARLAPAGPLDAGEWGDEAALLRWLQPDLPLIVGRRRVLAGEICHREFPDAVLLMDDGFQHLPLRKHVSIVLDPPVPNRRCLPAGPYREPWANRERADLVIPNGFRVEATPMRFIGPDGKERQVGPAGALCALGRPQAFLDAFNARLGDFLVGGSPALPVVVLPDHDPLSDGNLLSSFEKGATIVVTGKDWVKLRRRSDVEQYDFAIATREVAIEPREAFREWLQAKLDVIPKKETA
ncbi:MAG TPA: tetraacyldisaccharide 4'-kinase [Fimbriimonadaceae bacterium]|nr:tetraacyldisaccharide 4'-kinase [Fimbriimonadaceae bacterium]